MRENAEILKAVLLGKGTPAQEDIVALNTALALYVSETIPDTGNYLDNFAKAILLAKDILKSGIAWKKLEQFSDFIQ